MPTIDPTLPIIFLIPGPFLWCPWTELFPFRFTQSHFVRFLNWKLPFKPVFGPWGKKLCPFFPEVGTQNDPQGPWEWDEIPISEIEMILSRLRLRELTFWDRIIFSVIYSKRLYCNPNPQCLQKVTDYGARMFRGNQEKMRSLWWASLFWNWCLDKGEKLEADTCRRKMMRRIKVKIYILMSSLQAYVRESRTEHFRYVSYLAHRTLL